MKRNALLVSSLIPAWLVSACNEPLSFDWFDRPSAKPAEAPVERSADEIALTESLAFRDTIDSMTYPLGLRKMRVHGFGLVAGLGEDGSGECPKRVREHLIREMEKAHGIGFATTGLGDLTPEEMIADKDTAVVEVIGEIPAAATVGTRFDVQVTTFAGSQTTSLAGGRLYTCELKLFGSVGSGPIRAGKVLGKAWGPIFVNPFTEQARDGERRDVRVAVGRVLNGGRVFEPRRLRLQLSSPSYDRAYRIAARINERFGQEPKTAEPLSPSLIRLDVPPDYKKRPARFLELVRHLYLNPSHAFCAERAKRLALEVVRPTAPHMRIATAWEGMGRSVVPVAQSLYTHDAPYARYHSARAGLRLGDELAVDVLAAFAEDAQSPYQKDAIEILGEPKYMYRTTDVLKPLLDHADPRVRVAAYEALRGRASSGIRSVVLGKDNFMLDIVPTSGPGLIHARHAGEPRIAVFGPNLACRPPVFYTHPNRAVLINATESDTQLTVVRRSRFRKLVSPPIAVPFSVVELIRKLGDDPEGESDEDRGLAMGYDQVIRIVHTLCDSQTIPAKFVFDRPSITDVFGPMRPEGRPETDL